MRSGVTTTALIDCCHSANIFDLPYTLRSDDTKMERKRGFNLDVVRVAERPMSAKEKAKERYRQKKQKQKAERAAREGTEGTEEKSSSSKPQTSSIVDAAHVPTTVTRNGQGQIVITGNPSPEELAAIQNQMIKEAQEAALAQMSLTGGQHGRITVVPGQVMMGTGAPPTGATMKQNSGPQFVKPTVTVKAPPMPATIPRTKATPVPSKPKQKMIEKKIIHREDGPRKNRDSSGSRDEVTTASTPVLPSKPKKKMDSAATEKARHLPASGSRVKATAAPDPTPVSAKPKKKEKSSCTKKEFQAAGDSVVGTATAAPVPSKPKKKETTPVSSSTTNSKRNDNHHAVYYSAEDLRNQTIPGLDYTQRETYLSPTEFHSIFGMSRPEFVQLPQWKRTNMKRKQQLF